MQKPSEVVELVGMHRAVLVALGNAFTGPIVAEFDPVCNPTGAILQHAIGIFKIRAIGVDFGSEQVIALNLRGKPCFTAPVYITCHLIAGGRVLCRECGNLSRGVIGHFDGYVFVGIDSRCARYEVRYRLRCPTESIDEGTMVFPGRVNGSEDASGRCVVLRFGYEHVIASGGNRCRSD